MSDLDPYHRWLGIRDPERPPNHYRLLGLELFEDNLEVIEDAAQRQMAHVRTYQLGAHAQLSQQILNELAAAKVALLDPIKKADYDHNLRLERSTTPVAPPPQRPSEPEATRPTRRPPPRTAAAARPRFEPWQISVAVTGAAAVLVAALVVYRLKDRATGNPAAPVTPERQQEQTGDVQTPRVEPGPPPAKSPSATNTQHDAESPLVTGADAPVSPPTEGSGPTPLVREAGGPERKPEPPSPGASTNSAGQRASLLKQLTDRFNRPAPATPGGALLPELVRGHEIAQLAYAQVAVVSILRASREGVEPQVGTAFSKIEESNPAFGLIAAGGVVGDKSWQHLDACFDAYAAAVAQLTGLLREQPPDVATGAKVDEHVAMTEKLLEAVLSHCEERLGAGDDAPLHASLDDVRRTAAVERLLASGSLQRLCQLHLRICEALTVPCQRLPPRDAANATKWLADAKRDDYASGLDQLRSLLYCELRLWTLLATKQVESER